MKILGLAGGHRRIGEDSGPRTGIYSHDGAAVLLDDGVVVAACEQERVDRIKHSDKAPIEAIQRTLKLANVDIGAVDRIAYYASEDGLDRALKMARVRAGEGSGPGARALLVRLIGDGLGAEIAENKLVFVKHHLAHAHSAFSMSGHDDALIVTIDGIGEDESGLVATGHRNAIEVLRSIPPHASLGQFYCNVIAFLGYGLFDEYKVMGLAPFGDPARFADLFSTFYSLERDGVYQLHSDRILALADLGPPRRRGEPFTQVHRDIAAALQRALSACIFHMIAHARETTGLTNLCLAGGVAHNCTVNGELLRSGMFDDVFVQPAAHDAGCAIGAALVVHASSATAPARSRRLDHVYWGTTTDAADTRAAATRWSGFVTATPRTDIVSHAAERMAAGDVIGWVQGRAEFGPRALGNRSILADPRPARNKEVINAMVKKREGYRPFAPSVTIEDASSWFEIEPGRPFPFMNFVVGVRAKHRETLGAVTHVDGSARIQTVSREQNARYWELLSAFAAITGVPVLLNTSFNNHAEPIVDSAEDAMVCFLTTDLHALALGDLWIEKRPVDDSTWGTLVPSLVPHVRLEQLATVTNAGAVKRETKSRIVPNYDPDEGLAVSNESFAILARADGEKPIDALAAEAGLAGEARGTSLREVLRLWEKRVVKLAPSG